MLICWAQALWVVENNLEVENTGFLIWMTISQNATMSLKIMRHSEFYMHLTEYEKMRYQSVTLYRSSSKLSCLNSATSRPKRSLGKIPNVSRNLLRRSLLMNLTGQDMASSAWSHIHGCTHKHHGSLRSGLMMQYDVEELHCWNGQHPNSYVRTW